MNLAPVEPTASLDRAAEEELRNRLAALGKAKTILMVTHSPMMLQVCHNVVLMERGHIRAAGPTQKTLQSLTPVRIVAGGEAEPKPA